MDPQLFKQGETVSEYLESLQDSKARFLQHLEESTFDEAQPVQLARLAEQLNVLVIAEEW